MQLGLLIGGRRAISSGRSAATPSRGWVRAHVVCENGCVLPRARRVHVRTRVLRYPVKERTAQAPNVTEYAA